MAKPVQVLFVCMGNICRSPLAEGTFRHLVEREALGARIFIDSAGTHFYHIGDDPDPRSIETAKNNGIDISMQRARQVEPKDFEAFDYILAMDKRNLRDLKKLCPAQYLHKVYLYLETFAPELEEIEVPDPYYGGADGFEEVFRMVETAAIGLLADIRAKYLTPSELES